jgi:hypothetical protein
MPAEYDFGAIYLKARCLVCYVNVTRAGWPGPPPFPRLAGACYRLEAAEQAIVRDISR